MIIKFTQALVLTFFIVVAAAFLESKAIAETTSDGDANPTTRKVLVIYSYQDNLPWQKEVRQALFSRLDSLPEGDNTELYEERLEVNRLNPIRSEDSILKLMADKYSHVELDLIVTDNDYAFEFFERNPEIFPSISRQHITLTDYSNQEDVLSIKLAPITNIELILQLLPETSKIIALTNDDLMIKGLRTESFTSLIQPLALQKGIQLEVWNDFTFEELYQRVELLPDNVVLLFTPLFKDKLDAKQIPKKLLDNLVKVSPVPIFVNFSPLVGSGVVGGYLVSAAAIGNLIADAVIGIPLPENDPKITDKSMIYMLDYNAMNRWGINSTNLPDNYLIINRKYSFLEQYFWEISAALLALIFETLLIFSLLWNLKQRKKISSELLNERNLLEVRVDERTSELVDKNKRLLLSQQIFNDVHDGVFITDVNLQIIEVNSAFCFITAYDREDVIGQNPSILGSGKSTAEFYSSMWQEINKNKHWKGEIWNRKKSGELYAELLTISVLLDEESKVSNYVGVFSDVTSSLKKQESFIQMAHYDALTQLPNRALFLDRFNQALAHCQRNKVKLGVCFLDLDKFKPINDNFGHDIGDKLLIEVASRIKKQIRDEDTVARLGGDEFAILLGDVHSLNQCEQTLKRLHASLSQPYIINGISHLITASSGLTLYPDDDGDIDSLLQHADKAMYQSKASGRNTYHVFERSVIVN